MNTIYLISTELAALEEISKMCGEIKVKSGKGDKEKEETRPLITISDLQKLPFGEIILLRQRLNPFKTKLQKDGDMNWPPLFQSQSAKDAEYPSREKQPIHVFDLKGFVNKKKEEKIQNLINSNMGRGPMPNQMPGGMPGPMPGFPAMGPNVNQQRPARSGAVNVDELVKRIDQRLAELEEEEKKEKEMLNVKSKGGSSASLDSIVKSEPVIPKQVEPEPKPIVKEEVKKEVKKQEKVKEEPVKPATPKSERKIDKKDLAAKITSKVNKVAKEEKSPKETSEYVTDDQFFDDFFSDDI